jgi:hypothetical protein
MHQTSNALEARSCIGDRCQDRVVASNQGRRQERPYFVIELGEHRRALRYFFGRITPNT